MRRKSWEFISRPGVNFQAIIQTRNCKDGRGQPQRSDQRPAMLASFRKQETRADQVIVFWDVKNLAQRRIPGPHGGQSQG